MGLCVCARLTVSVAQLLFLYTQKRRLLESTAYLEQWLPAYLKRASPQLFEAGPHFSGSSFHEAVTWIWPYDHMYGYYHKSTLNSHLGHRFQLFDYFYSSTYCTIEWVNSWFHLQKWRSLQSLESVLHSTVFLYTAVLVWINVLSMGIMQFRSNKMIDKNGHSWLEWFWSLMYAGDENAEQEFSNDML